MSYKVLAIKWRPKKFEDVVDQDHILTALQNSLKSGKLHHAYLFSGSYGIGKTTIARILAKGLNCIKNITDSPCNICLSCIEINQGKSVDLIEVDAASKTKIEDIKNLLDNIQYYPTRDRFKIYLIDEIHMLSKYSFNALLKTLEEPPKHIKFLFATTDPQKIPNTILSRCLHFHLKSINENKIKKHIEHILKLEKIKSDFFSCKLIANASKGSMRNALSLLDKAIAIGNGKVLLNSVKKMLGMLDHEVLLKIIEAIAQKNPKKTIEIIEKIYLKWDDPEKILIEMMLLIHKIIIIQILPIKKNFLETKISKKLYLFAKSIKPIYLHYYYKMLLIGKKELSYSPNKKIGLEITLLRILVFQSNYIKKK